VIWPRSGSAADSLSPLTTPLLLFVGQQYTTSGIASITYSLVPIATAAVAAAWIGGSDLDARGGLGVVLAFIGVGLVAQPDPANLAGGVTIGVGLISIGVIAVAVGSVGLRTVRRPSPTLRSPGGRCCSARC